MRSKVAAILILLVFMALAVQAAAADTGWYKVFCNEDDASVYIDDKYQGMISGGSYTITWDTSSNPPASVRLEKEGYVTASQSMPSAPAPGQTVSVYVTMQKKQSSQNGQLSVESNPSKAEVYIDNVYKGTAPITIALSSGTYTVMVSKEGYDSKSETIVINNGDTIKKKFSLKRNAVKTGTVTVSSVPEGASVYLDNVYCGVTPVSLPDVESGSHAVSVVSAGYDTYSENIILTANTEKTVNAVLSESKAPSTGNLYVSSVPGGADIYIDEKLYGKTGEDWEEYAVSIPAGKHVVKLTKSGYFPYEEEITVSKDSSSTVSAKLAKAGSAYTSDSGSVYITSNPAGAAVYIDGRLEGATPLRLSSVSSGTHSMRLVCDGYEDLERSLNVGSSGVSTVDVDMKPSDKAAEKKSSPSAVFFILAGIAVPAVCRHLRR